MYPEGTQVPSKFIDSGGEERRHQVFLCPCGLAENISRWMSLPLHCNYRHYYKGKWKHKSLQQLKCSSSASLPLYILRPTEKSADKLSHYHLSASIRRGIWWNMVSTLSPARFSGPKMMFPVNLKEPGLWTYAIAYGRWPYNLLHKPKHCWG